MEKPKAERAGVNESTYFAKGPACSRMEPRGRERHRWANPPEAGRNERERVSQSFRSRLQRLVRRCCVHALVASRLLQVFAQGFDSLVD
jgi:hypothetical protein